MRFNGLDLNLLVAFQALLEHRSVSRAAEQLNLSQPAVSAALARLRAYFGDDILVVHGKKMLPTAFAESLLPQVLDCLQSAAALIATTATFDAATSHRSFRVVASDYAIATVLTSLVHHLANIAPGIRLEFLLPDERVNADLEEGRVDLIVTPEQYLSSSHPAELMFDERHVVAGCRDNPLFRARISEEAFFASSHVSVSIGRHRQIAYGDEHLAALGKRRRVDVIVPSFAIVPGLVVGTLRLALMHERLARQMADRYPIAYRDLPFEFPVMREMAQYHRARAADEGLRWLRAEIRAASSRTCIHESDGIQ